MKSSSTDMTFKAIQPNLSSSHWWSHQ